MTARTTVLQSLLALAEAAILSPIVWLIVPGPKSASPIVLVGCVWAALAVLSIQRRALANRGAPLVLERALMGGWLVVLIVAGEIDTIGPAPARLPDTLTMLPGFVAALLVWWRGMALGNYDLHPRAIDLHFQVGTLFLIGTSLTSLFSRSTETLSAIAAFFFASLTCAPLANLEFTHQHRVGRATPMTRRWWAWVVGAALGVVTLGLCVTALETGKSAVEILVTLITLVLLPIVLLLALLPVSFFDWLVGLLRRLLSGLGHLLPLQPPQTTQDPSALASPIAPVNLPPELHFGLAIVVFVALALLVIMLAQRARRLAAAPARNTTDSEGQLTRAPAASMSGLASRFGISALRHWLATVTIRRLYARAVHEAAKRGHKRLAVQTPYDFLATMQRAFPMAEADARIITDAYVAAHYGEVPDSPEALDLLKAAWERMRVTRVA